MKRREFLKLASSLPLVALAPSPTWGERRIEQAVDTRRNVLILVFDTFSAVHAGYHGYPRNTTPNLDRFAERATVYHNHYSPGSFTNPGTASFLTGTYPWTNRAYLFRSWVAEDYVRKNIFRVFRDQGYYTFAYSHNLIATTILYQMRQDLDRLMDTRELCLVLRQVADGLFRNDYDLALWRERLFRGGEGLFSSPTSLWAYLLGTQHWYHIKRKTERAYRDQYPRGLPGYHDGLLVLEDAVDWIKDNLAHRPTPFLGYFHFLPPHAPYNPRREFIGKFDDGWQPTEKSRGPFSSDASERDINMLRLHYDEYVAYVDAEFGRLVDALERSGMLDSTYLVVTSDHGEMFERGIWGHSTEVLYDPVVKVPLLVSSPGQQERKDVDAVTSAIDVLPTLASANDLPVPLWCEGQILPGFGGGDADDDRAVYLLDAKTNSAHTAITRGSAAILRDRHKLVRYFGYAGLDEAYELYDLDDDPLEVRNLYSDEGELAGDLRAELLDKLSDVNAPYRS